MANTLYTPEAVARLGIALIGKDMVLANTVNRDYDADFVGGKGKVVNAKVPAFLEARSRNVGATGAITIDDVSESYVAIELTEQAYSAVALTDADLSLNLEDFGRQVLAPQTSAVAVKCEKAVVAAMQAITPHATLTWDAADPLSTLVAARKALRDMGVPASNLYAAVGTSLAADLLSNEKIARVDASGSNAALVDAQIGRLHGFTIVESNRLAEDEVVFYHRNAFTLAVRAPQVPAGAAFGQSLSNGGFALTYIRDYDSNVLADRSVVSTFIGAQELGIQGEAGLFTPAIRIA